MVMRKLVAGLLGAVLLPLPLMAKDEPTKVPPGTPVTITVQPAAPSTPTVSLQLDDRHGHVTPVRVGFTHTGGGLIAVATPDTDTIVVTFTGVVVAGGHPCKDSSAEMNFDFNQVLEVSWDSKDVKACKVTMDGQVIGVLRSECKGGGTATEAAGNFVLSGDGVDSLSLVVPPHSVSGDNLGGELPRRPRQRQHQGGQVRPARLLEHRRDAPAWPVPGQGGFGRLRPGGPGPALDQLLGAVPRDHQDELRPAGDAQDLRRHRQPAAGKAGRAGPGAGADR